MNEMSTSGYNPIYEFLTKAKQNIKKSNLFENSPHPLPPPLSTSNLLHHHNIHHLTLPTIADKKLETNHSSTKRRDCEHHKKVDNTIQP
jgi:hypothetical protein